MRRNESWECVEIVVITFCEISGWKFQYDIKNSKHILVASGGFILNKLHLNILPFNISWDAVVMRPRARIH